MNIEKPFKIRGTGVYVPQTVLASEELEQLYNIPKGWSEKYSGVSSRYIEKEISCGEMGARSIENALLDADMQLSEIDLLINASVAYDYILPNLAAVIKASLPNSQHFDFPVISINSACTGFISAIEIASQFLNSAQYKNIVIVNAEISSRFINHENWETATLFGDAATAVIIGKDEKSDSGLVKAMTRTYSEGAFQTIIKGGGNVYPYQDYGYDKSLHSFRMEGRPLLKLAKQSLPLFMKEFFKNLNIGLEDINFIIPHQASKAGLAIFKKMYNLKDGQMLGNLAGFGNCISASIPLLLHELRTTIGINKGDTCFLCGTSAGFTIAGALIKF